MRIRSVFRLLPLAVLLAACTGQPPLPGTRVGKPYMEGFNVYFPSYDETYDKVGEASWYGPGFNGKKTASGETFNQNDLTAASPTLPMPSLVRVTNLQNGKSLVIRINDRGPFAANRIIDLSKRSAHELGIKSIAQVRVKFLKAETEDFIARSQTEGHPVSMAYYNQPAAQPMQVAANMPVTAPTPSQSQIVESNVNESHAGDTVNTVAPLVTVSSNNLPPATTNLSDRHGKPVGGIGLVQQAWADDNVTMPAPPAAEKEGATGNTDADSAGNANVNSDDAEPAAPSAPHHATRRTSSSASLVIQAGAFSTQAHAKRLAAKLDGIATTVIDKIEAGGKELWRVQLGPFADKAEAEGILAKVRALGIADARITH